MKRLFSLLLICALVGSLSACKSKEETFDFSSNQPDDLVSFAPSEEETNDSPSKEEKNPATQAPEKKPQADETPTKKPASSNHQAKPQAGYQALTCRASKDISWQKVRFRNDAEDITVELQLPADWEIKEASAKSLRILRKSQEIGILTTNAFAEPLETFEPSNLNADDNETYVYRTIVQYREGGKDQFYHQFEINCDQEPTSLTAYLRINYAELDKTAAETVLNSIDAVSRAEVVTPYSKGNGAKKILILGNSFINSSKIADQLNEMLSASGCPLSAEGISVGYATVESYSEDTRICAAIRSGEYSHVFQCGFYSKYESLDALGLMREHCRAADTNLVIFPAHNESETAPQLAAETYRDVAYLDWKGEINALIDGGINKWEFCIDDQHKHSTPLAGYVGAHMIYRSLFHQAPPLPTENSIVGTTPIKLFPDFLKKDGTEKVYFGTIYKIK